MAGSTAVLKVYEPDRYYAALLTPRHRRDDVLALVAFAAELRRVAVEVSEPMIGEIRLQWWADAVHDTRSGGKTGNPIADDFAAVARKYELPQELIDGMIDAVRARVHASPPENPADLVPDLIAYESGLFTLWGLIRNAGDQQVLRHVARPAAIAYGMARLLYEVAPQQTGARFEPALSETVARDLHKEAQIQLTAARDGVAGLTSAGKRVFLPLALVEPYLRLWKLNCDGPAQPGGVAQLSQLRRMWLIWRGHMTGRC